jgi:hypothetical protein
LDTSFFSFDAGDAAAAGLAVVAGVVVLLGAGVVVDGAVVDGVDVVLGEFELFSDSPVQAAANAIDAVASSASAMRLISFTFGLVISFPRPAKIEKQDDNCATED